jgi:hypothetical protein
LRQSSRHFLRLPLGVSPASLHDAAMRCFYIEHHTVSPRLPAIFPAFSATNEAPNHALQRTAPAVTLAASTAAFPPTVQPARQPPPSLSLGSLGGKRNLIWANFNQSIIAAPNRPQARLIFLRTEETREVRPEDSVQSLF